MEELPPIQSESPAKRSKSDQASLGLIVTRFSIAAGLVIADLQSKSRVFEWLTENSSTLTRDAHGHDRHQIVGEWFSFLKSRNSGAAWGFLASVPHLLVGGRIVAVLILAWLVLRSPRTRGVITAGLVLILAGATGNLWDNLFLERRGDLPFGEVRDFIDVYFPAIGESGWHFPAFNVADACITVGAALLLFSGLGGGRKNPGSTKVGVGEARAKENELA